jgi:hypothetical protein
MKESNFYSDDFEQLIRDKTEQYKMYPSENVWKGVHNSLHTKRKWFIGSMSVLVTGILFLAGRELIAPSVHPIAARKTAAAAGSAADPSKGSAPENILHTPLAAYRPATAALTNRHSADAANTAGGEDPVYKGINITISNPVLDQSDLSEWLSHVVRLPDHAPDLPVVIAKTALAEQWRAAEDAGHAQDMTRVAGEVAAGHHETTGETATKDETDEVRNALEGLSAGDAGTAGGILPRASRPGGRLTNTRSGGSVTGKEVADAPASSTKADGAAIAEADDVQRVNWLRDYAMNILPSSSTRGRTFLQLTLSPTIDFRSLNGIDPMQEKFGTTGSGSLNPSPGFGFEVGGTILYRLTRNLSIKAGLQFNFIRYQIGTYASTNSQTKETVYYTPKGYSQDSMQQRIGMNNPNNAMPPKNAVTLNNDYMQLSAPIGFELRVLGNERLQLHVGANVQPSYLLNTTAYKLNEDFTQYQKQPSMYRRWNVSGGVETFLTYRMGDVRWQIGPEFRYQFLSSYYSQYANGHQNPITENLKSYGIKIGITKPLP